MCSVREKTTIYLAQRVQSFKPSTSQQIWFQSRFDSERDEFALLSLVLAGCFFSKRNHRTAWHVKAEQEVFAKRMSFAIQD